MTGYYLHIPFCAKRCAYCDFYSQTDCSVIQNYVSELITEIRSLAVRFPEKTIKTVYFGGGTPGLLQPDEVRLILDAIRNSYDCRFEEVTLEVNPSSARNFAEYREAGVTRVSVGVQSLNDKTLKTIGRLHNAEEALITLEAAHRTGLRVSADLMLALPDEDERDIARFVDGVSPYANHISAYLLKVEDATPLKKAVDSGKIILCDDARQAELYEFACSYLEKNGYRRYEISNFAREGEESRHNLLYWHMEEYFGAGASAHSFMNGKRFYNKSDLSKYLQGFHSGNGKEIAEDTLHSLEERKDEAVMLALRTSEGLCLSDFRNRFGADFFEAYQKGFEAAKKYLIVEKDRIFIKKDYLLLENSVLSSLLQ